MQTIIKKIQTSATLALSVLLLASCQIAPYEEHFANMQAVEPEVSYGYVAVNSSCVVKNGQTHSYENLAEELLGTECEYHGSVPFDDTIYFFVNYGHHEISVPVENSTRSVTTYDVGLLRLELQTLTTELVYDFKNTYPPYGTYSTWYRLGEIIDENTMLVRHNGMLQILNLQTKEITYSVDAYDKEFFSTLSHYYAYCVPQFLTSKDFICVEANTLSYYEWTGSDFILHTYSIHSEIKSVTRWKNYVLTHNTTYIDCYDLTTDERVELDVFLKEKSEAEKEEAPTPSPETQPYVINEKQYYIQLKNDNVEILDEDKKQVARLTVEQLAEKSPKFAELRDIFWPIKTSRYNFLDFTVVDGRLFVGISAEYGLRTTPTYIYEYDIEANDFYYVGYNAADCDLSDLQIYEK